MSSPTMTTTDLRIPHRRERPKFSPDVPDHVQAHIWILWLRKTASRSRTKRPDPVVHISGDGAEELAALIERLAQGGRR